MAHGSSRTQSFFPVAALLLVIVIAGSGCIAGNIPDKSIPAVIIPEKNQPDPVTGTWNGFIATSPQHEPVADAAVNDEVRKIRLNIYPDRTFEYTTNFTIRNGTLIATGKGNYVVKANDTETERKYFRYDGELDTLKWESQDLTIEFRRNDRVFTRTDLEEYNSRLLEAYKKTLLAALVTTPAPEPPRAVAYIWSEGFGYDPTSETVYEMKGAVLIESGQYGSVSVILRYPDNDEYRMDAGPMGGSNYTKKEIRVILNDRVKDMEPRFFVRLDSTEYPAVQTNVTRNRIVYTAFDNSI